MLQVSARKTYLYTNRYVGPLMIKYIHNSGSVLIKLKEGNKLEYSITNDRVAAKDTFCLWSQYCTEEMGCICVESRSVCLVCVLLACVWEQAAILMWGK